MLPIINKLLEKQEPPIVEAQSAQPQVVIVSPTRELAIQICEQGKKFAHNSIVKVVEIYGGTSVGYQRSRVSVSIAQFLNIFGDRKKEQIAVLNNGNSLILRFKFNSTFFVSV